ncbi:MAG: single-stranded-DNA-specific exonuclease RecJ [Ferruginibacter sp.]|jgi:single-stranded-DNA-specific exonuclease|nr:single-stranded-DNA-specific exonuclease RecJ [Ferruginibacter sp.]MBN8699497.1 single-stranded-DNA-specific exonuclease RecJ [Chitinophagales bacterium]
MERRWKIAEADAKKTDALQEALKVSNAICGILVQRGIDDFTRAKAYFRPQWTDLHDPWLMKDMQKAVDRLFTAFTRKEKILVFGDYDVDGTTSVACMFRFLCKIYDPALLDFYIPHRYREGYGVSKMGIDYAKENNFSLIVSLDCGIKSVELIAYAKTLGIDFIVCDHHLPDAELPPAAAILNPKQKDCPYPYKELCGCGVGFKLITALTRHLNLEEEHYKEYIDLVAVAIAADIVPMTGENRVLAYYGLQKINEAPNPGIRALIHLGNIQKKLSINNVVFVIAPRVNAAGRMDDARKAVQMFLEDDYPKALGYAEMLHSDNSDRKEADKEITSEALAIINADPSLQHKKTTVVFREHWHKGVVGIVASRLIETYYRPTVVLTKSGDIAAGSARSVPGFNLYEAIHACREHLLGYGGHFAAAGLSLLPEQVEAFAAKFEETVSATIPEQLLVPEITVDAVIRFKDINAGFYSIICQMEPFGPENMRPVFVAERVLDTGYSKVVKEEHLRFVVKQDNISFTGIGFNLAGKFPVLSQPFDMAFTLDENEWNGNTTLQLKVIDIRPSQPL